MVSSRARIVPAFAMLVLSWSVAAAPDTAQPAPDHGAKSAQSKPMQAKSPRSKPAQPKSAATSAPAPQSAQTKQPDPKSDSAAAPSTPKSDEKPGEGKVAAHFASLRAEKVYLRSGPSADYPIQWVFVRRGLPVEILAAFDIWRKIRDSSGTEGWIHQGMLTGRRNVLVAGAIRDLRHDPTPQAPVVAQLEPGVVAGVSKCDLAWCEVRVGGYRGWIRHDEIWGLEPNEIIQ